MPEPRFDPDSIDPDSIVRAAMDADPATVAVVPRRRMHGPGCVMAPFMTLAEAAANCGVDPAGLVRELRAAVRPRPGVPT